MCASSGLVFGARRIAVAAKRRTTGSRANFLDKEKSTSRHVNVMRYRTAHRSFDSCDRAPACALHARGQIKCEFAPDATVRRATDIPAETRHSKTRRTADRRPSNFESAGHTRMQRTCATSPAGPSNEKSLATTFTKPILTAACIGRIQSSLCKNDARKNPPDATPAAHLVYAHTSILRGKAVRRAA
ncbi:hypothetical protein BamIOP4010DRAFT_1311 [Burkholderia ambifaria IOP40-10]|uniref:Uncharacterized protein n=1 Tax=Burkholderia ambifaria IOP40-10 TaxID=396596 RepID=B1FBA2_9BURK|nr:hypothetical protein BamIOP4010DRAFT_1311 [Burkholderia ambifaria IOP40-10]